MAKPIKIHKDGETKWTEADRLQRFLDEGWSLESGVQSPKVTINVEDDDEDEDWDINQEDWADSAESMIVEDDMPNEEEN